MICLEKIPADLQLRFSHDYLCFCWKFVKKILSGTLLFEPVQIWSGWWKKRNVILQKVKVVPLDLQEKGGESGKKHLVRLRKNHFWNFFGRRFNLWCWNSQKLFIHPEETKHLFILELCYYWIPVPPATATFLRISSKKTIMNRWTTIPSFQKKNHTHTHTWKFPFCSIFASYSWLHRGN